MTAHAGRRILLTGAAGAFGAAAAAELRARGARVVGIDREPGDGLIAADVRDGAAVSAAVGSALEELGGLDVLVNCAGIGDATPAGVAPDERALAIVDVNLFGTWRVTAAALPALLASRGRVVIVSSGLAFVTVPFAAAYLASKRGVAAYADALRLEYGDRISVTTVYPGYVRTPIHDAAAARGLSLEGAVPSEPLAGTVRAIVEVCDGRARRSRATSVSGRIGYALARLAPAGSDRVVRRRARRLIERGRLAGADAATMGVSSRP